MCLVQPRMSTYTHAIHYIYADHVPSRDPPLHILVGAYFHTNSFHSIVRKYISYGLSSAASIVLAGSAGTKV